MRALRNHHLLQSHLVRSMVEASRSHKPCRAPGVSATSPMTGRWSGPNCQTAIQQGALRRPRQDRNITQVLASGLRSLTRALCEPLLRQPRL